MRTITVNELRKRGVLKGDLIFIKHIDEDFTGWYLAISDEMSVGLSIRSKNIYGNLNDESLSYKITRIVKNEDFSKEPYMYRIAIFFRTFDESMVSNIITHITKAEMAKYVHAVHFGSSKPYTWRVPEALEKVNFTVGDIVEVDTMFGKQYVQVKETAEYEYDEKTKEVLSLIKTKDLPF